MQLPRQDFVVLVAWLISMLGRLTWRIAGNNGGLIGERATVPVWAQIAP